MIKINPNWQFSESPGPEITAYTTTWNCLNGKYPVEQAIRSFSWCDKIVVVDGGSTDGTLELLRDLASNLKNLSIIEIPIDKNNPGKDGFQKAMALAMCDTPIAIQFDIDEVCLGSSEKWRSLIKEMPSTLNILNLPVIEPFGSAKKIRVNKEHTPWKWRIFRTKPEITHGIPKSDQLLVNGIKHSKGGSDGCFPIHVVTEEMYPSANSKTATKLTNLKNKLDPKEYSEYISELIEADEPCIMHLGHVDLENKIRHYLTSWHAWWCQLYNKDPADPKNNVYFPGVAVFDVTEENIKDKVSELCRNTQTVTIGL
jgi:glycosyltransferase involved in cell wall biosynthesis